MRPAVNDPTKTNHRRGTQQQEWLCFRAEIAAMPFGSSPRAKGGRGKKKESVAWAVATASSEQPQQQQHHHHHPGGAEEKAPFSSNGITASSPYSSNSSSGAAERMRTLDMDPEAVSHVSERWACGCGGGKGEGLFSFIDSLCF